MFDGCAKGVAMPVDAGVFLALARHHPQPIMR